MRELEGAQELDRSGAAGRDYFEQELTTGRVRPRLEAVYEVAAGLA